MAYGFKPQVGRLLPLWSHGEQEQEVAAAQGSADRQTVIVNKVLEAAVQLASFSIRHRKHTSA